jgi:hypothetical protein
MAVLLQVLTLVCRLSLPDGRQVTGKVEARTPGLAYHIVYSGATDCLDLKPAEGTPSDLELIFRMAGQANGGMVSVEKRGDYESRTENFTRTD